MVFVIYKITNLINSKYYIGRHATKNINDNYYGSGTGIKNAIKKYGIENFKKEIIAQARTREDLWLLEEIIVNSEVVNDPLSYNVAHGGINYLNGLKNNDHAKFIDHQRSAGRLGGIAYHEKHKRIGYPRGHTRSAITKENMRNGMLNSTRYICPLCDDSHKFDGGNFSKHLRRKHTKTTEEIYQLKLSCKAVAKVDA
jgi:hypothetical protein